ncbi:LPD38 domain-containing protein [Phascolarctobacterium sp.]|uniref:LPD38 domain-containing protein n=1 Tax=Phascolarctobacterium sp. TaxID=2049039 RepID=UPI003076A7BD
MSYNPFLRKQNSASDNPFLTKRTNEQQQDEEIGYLDSLTKGLKSGGAGVYRDMAYLVGADDTNKYLDSIVQDNAPNKQFDSIWSMDYVTDPEGLTRTIGETVGSSLALTPAALALPETAAAGAAGLAVKGLGKLGLKKAAQWGATEAGKKALKLGARGAMTSLPESASEWGGAAEEAEAMGSKTPRADTVSVLGGNMVTLPASNALEYMLLGGKLFHPTAKVGEGLATRALKAPLRMAPSVAANATQNAAEELVQQTLSDNAVGKPVGNPFFPGSWTDEQRISFEQGLAGGAGLAGIGGGARALRRNNAPNAIERKAAEERPDEVAGANGAGFVDNMRQLEGKIPYKAEDGTNCMRTIGIALAGTPFEGQINVDQAVATGESMGLLRSPEDYVPKAGDIAVVEDGNHAVMVTEDGGTIQNGASANGVYESKKSPAEMFGKVKYYIETSSLDGANAGELNTSDYAKNAQEVENQGENSRGFVVDDELSPVDAYLAEQERIRNEAMTERWDEAAGRSGFMPQSYYDNPVDFYLNQRFIEMIEKVKRNNGKETAAAKIEVPKKYLNSDAAVRGLRGLERDTVEGIRQMYPDDLAKGWKHEQQRVQRRYDEMLEPALKELRSGMKQGVEVIRPDGEDKGYRASRNAPWYSDFYRQYKRPPTQAELRELAYEAMTGQRNILPGFENNSAESAAYFAEQKQAFDSMRSQLAAFDAIKSRLTGDKKENADTQLVTPGTYVQAVERAKSDLAGAKSNPRREKLAERAVSNGVAIKAAEGMLDGDAAATETFNSYIPEVRSALLNKIGEERGYDGKTDERREDKLQDAEFKQVEEGKDKAGAQDENAEALNKKAVSVEENIANGERAMRQVIDTHEDVESAMYREDIGDIDFVWGKEGRGTKFKGGYGIAHIIAKRDAEGISGNDFVLNIPKTIALGKVSGKQEASNGDRVLISNGSKTVVLSLFKDGNRKTWLVTSWDESAYENKKTTPSAAEAVYDADSATGKGTTRSRSDTDGVVLSTTNISPASQNVKESKKATEIIKETEEKHEPVKKEDVPELDEDIQFYVKSDPDGGFYIHRNGANEHLQEFDNFKDAVNYQKKNRDSLLKQVRGEKVVEGEPAKYSIKNKSEALQTKTPEFKRWFGQSKVVDENGEPLVVYHGTKRADRVGNVFRPDRATSGPMAFFTDNKEIAENYSKDKADTSLAAEFGDGSYYEQFRVKTKWDDYSIRSLWGYIPINKRIELSKRAGEITLDDDGEIIIEHGNTKGIGNYDYELKENRGDAVKALVEGWLNGGTLFGEEGRFIEVLEKAGILDAAEAVGIPKENIYYNDPNKTDAAVYPVYMKIEKPFDTSKDITKKVIQELERAAKKAPPATDRAVDMWDKQGVDPSDWVERLQDDFDQGTSFAWTTIPDFVTDYLKAKGYDGIKDTGGKSGGNGHNVYIPFESTQIKSATDNVGSFDADNPDIRYGIKNDKGEELNPIALDEWEAQAKDAFPNAKNFSRDGSVMEFDLPNGEHMRINVVDRVVLDDAEFERAQADYGGKLERDAEVLGSVRTIGKNAFMTLAQENVRGTIDHEALHYARTHGLTGRENAALERAFKGNEEAMAEAYRKWRIKWKELKEGSDWGKLWRKVKDFAAKVADFLGFETEHDIFRKIESGEVWERGSNNGKTDSSYKVTNSQITGETRIPVVDVTGLPKVDVNSSSQKVAIARSLIGKTFRIIGSNGIGRVASMGDGRHLVGGSNNTSRTDTVRRQALSTVENVLNNAVYIEKHLDGQHGTKNRYVELYAVVKDGNNLTRFRIVAKEGNGNSSEFEVKDAKFYDIIKDGTLSPSMPKSISTAQLPDGNQSQLKDNIPSSTVSVAELLTGVKDRQGVPYVNRDGGLNYDAEALKGIKHSMRKTTNYDELLDPAHIKKINNVERAKVAKLVKSFKLDGYKGRPIVVMDNANEGYIGLTGSHRIAAAEEVGVEIPAVVIPANGETVKLLDVRDDDELATVAETLHNNNEISDNAYQLLTEEDSHWNDVKYSIFSEGDESNRPEREFSIRDSASGKELTPEQVLEQAKRSIPNGKNFKLDGATVSLEMPNGRKLTINLVDEIIATPEELKRASAEHGKAVTSSKQLQGSMRTAGLDGIIELTRDSEGGTIDHEVMELALKVALTDKHKRALEAKYKSKEEQCDAYRDWQLLNKQGKGGAFGRLWRLVQNFADNVMAFFGSVEAAQRIIDRGAEQVFEDVASGKVWESGGAIYKGSAAPNFSVGKSKIKRFVEAALKSKDGKLILTLGKVSKDEAEAIKANTGLDVGGYIHVWESADVRHVQKHHGIKTERNAEQAGLDRDDMLNALEAIESPNEIKKGTPTKNGEPSIRFIKNGDNGEYTVVEVVRQKNKRLAIKTMWKKANKNKEESSAKHHADNIDLQYTSENGSRQILASDNNLSPKADDVKYSAFSKKSVDAAIKGYEKQGISSADTSLMQIPAVFKKIKWVPGTVNIDIGGGKYDLATEYAKEQGVENVVFDPFNRNKKHNEAAFEKIKTKGDTATVANVLNVIAEEQWRDNVILQAAKSIKKNGIVYFSIYEGDGAGEGRVTSKGWQNNKKTSEYVAEIEQHFDEVKRKGNIIEARNPNVKVNETAVWFMGEGALSDISYSVKDSDKPLTSGQKAARAFTNTERKGTVKSAVDWMIDAKKNAYTNWIDKNDSLHGFDEAISMGLGRKLSDDESVYNKAQTMRANAAGLASALIEGDERSIEAINERLKNKKLPHKVTLAMVLDTVNRKVMDKKYPDYLQRNDFKNWTDAVGTYLGCMRLREMEKIVRDAYAAELAEWRDNGSKGKMPEFKPYKLPGSLTEADLQAVIDGAPAEFRRAADLYYKFNDNLLTVMEDAGLISAEVHRLLNTKYKYYAPLMRDFSDTAAADNFIGGLQGLGRGIANVSSTLKKISIEGSERSVLNPLESTIKAVAVVASRAERNKVGQAAVALAGESGLEGAVWKVPGSSADAKNCIFTVMENGKKVAYQTTPELYGPIVGYNETSAGVVFGLLRNSARLLRSGATMSPSFIVRNLIKDTFFASVSSKTGFIPVLDTVRGIHALLRNPKLRAEFEAAGVNKFNFYGSNEAIAKSLDDLTGGKEFKDYSAGDIWRALLKYPALFSELAESGTRMGEFMRARKQGISIDEAARYARELTLDYGRSGVQGEKVNQIVPFFNACLQGGDKMVRLLKNDPVNTMTALGKYIIVPSILLWCLNHDEDWYKELDPDVKNSCWCLPGGIRIPKPQEAGIFFGSGVEAILDMASNEDPAAMENFGKTFLANAAPGFLPTLVLPMVEWQANYSFFRGQQLVGKRLERLPDEMQYNPGTSEAAKAVGSVTKWSPVKIDNTIRGYTGTMGMFLAQVFDPLVAEKRNMPTKKFGELTFIRDFTLNDNIKNRSVNDFYEMMAAANEQHAGYGVKGRPTAVVKNIRKAGELISKANKDIRNITTSTAISPDEKRARIDKRKEYIRNVAKRANQLYGKYY